jgi:hypothetical protein
LTGRGFGLENPAPVGLCILASRQAKTPPTDLLIGLFDPAGVGIEGRGALKRDEGRKTSSK